MSKFFVYASNRLEKLVDKLAENLRTHPLPPMQEEIIVVQSKGMQRWVDLEIAKKNKIAANIVYPFPKGFVYDIWGKVSNIPEESPFSPDIMTWTILAVLPDLIEQNEFESIRHYLKRDPAGLKRFQLAEKLAGLFDQYLIYRPDIILSWDRGEGNAYSQFPEAKWQAALWKEIVSKVRIKHDADDNADLYHHAALNDLFKREIASVTDLPERVSVFGISTLPPFYIDFFEMLSKKSDVRFYYLNPCREYWEYAYSQKEVARFSKSGISEEEQYYEEGNSLLSSMGNSGREFFSLILNRVGDIGDEVFFETSPDSILTCIQSDILNLRDRKIDLSGSVPVDPIFVSPEDTSVQVCSCHSPVREIEVLYDQLLSLFDEKKDLLPKDVVVMMPDVSTYAPIIQAVFENPEREGKVIPYSIADTYIRNSSTIADTFLKILTLNKNRYKAVDVLDILENEAVRKKFQLTESDLEQIKRWVKETGINWGIDDAYREDIGLPGFSENTWKFGLDRMLLGYALSPEDDMRTFSEILPYGEIEGDNTGVLGVFLKFVELLFSSTCEIEKSRSLSEWAETLGNVLAMFFIPDVLSGIKSDFTKGDTTESDIKDIRDTLTDKGLMGFATLSGFDDTVSSDVIYSYLEKRLGRESGRHGFISSGVTFCTLLPMRSIPFKVVCLLGMNDGDFPRVEQKLGFDLMEKQKRLCDRSKRQEDRYLFLESLLSARENLFISYVGQSIKDNTELPPSVLVSELLDYIAATFKVRVEDDISEKDILDQILIRHPLQPFSIRYFSNDKKLFSFSEENFTAALKSLKTNKEKSEFITDNLPGPLPKTWETVAVEALGAFLCNPSEFLLRNRLFMNLRLEDLSKPSEREPVELDALQQYMIKDDLLQYCLQEEYDENIYDGVKRSGKLPHGSFGKAEFTKMLDEMLQFADHIRPYRGDGRLEPEEVHINLNTPRITINGALKHLYPKGQLFYRPATIKTKDLLRAWIYHLSLNFTHKYSNEKITRLMGKDRLVIFNEMENTLADSALKAIVRLFNMGMTQPLPFFPETSYAFAKKILGDDKSVDEGLKSASGKWHSGFMHTGECENTYIQTCFGNELPETELFQKTAIDVFEPIFQVMEEEKIRL